MTTDITVTDMFCGAGGMTTGATLAGADVQLAINHWSRAIETHNTNYPGTTHVLTDLHKANPRRFRRTKALLAAPECFPAGTLILTKKGLKPIEAIEIGDEVFTHLNRWRAVTQIMASKAETVVIKGRGHCGLELTKNHPVWARQCTYPWNNAIRRNKRCLGKPTWVEAEKLQTNAFWAMPKAFGDEVLPIPEVGGRGVTFTPEFWWMIGRWLGDGNLRLRFRKDPREMSKRRQHRTMPALCEVCDQPALTHKRYPHLAQFYCSKVCKHKAEAVNRKSSGSSLQICCSHKEAETLEKQLKFAAPKGNLAQKGEYRWSRREMRTATLFDCPHDGLAIWLLEQFGQYADGKQLPAWVLTMPIEWRQALLAGYVSADGNHYRDGLNISTVSRPLAVGVMLLVASLGFHPTIGKDTRSHYNIEGRVGTIRTLYSVRWAINSERVHAEGTENHIWGRIKSVAPGRESTEVFNLSVAEDESYIADGIVVHNCTNHSVAKGHKRKGQGQAELWDTTEEQDLAAEVEERSRCTMWTPLDWAECHDYQVVLLENVVDAHLWRPFQSWLQAWKSLDYEFELVFFNSMHAHPTPQSRDRMYFVAWKRGQRRPDLKITPSAYCATCGKDIQSIQSWKNPGRRYGKYRQQYVYRCPQCAREVIPYYYAAANAIDWSIPAPKIGDRKKPLREKTRQRIAYGLEKFAGGDPFSIPMTRVQDRLRSMVQEAFPTQTATETQGLVTPPFLLNLNHPNTRTMAVDEQPFPTQTAYDDLALVHPFIAELHGTSTARSVTDALATVCAGRQHHGLVVPPPFILDHLGEYRPRALTRAFSTICASGNHHSLVVPPSQQQSWLMTYYNHGQLAPIEEAVPTITTLERHALVIREQENAHTIAVDDCGFRMLAPSEIQAAMAFPCDYVVTGTRREQVKQLGNACTPPVVELLMRRLIASLQ